MLTARKPTVLIVDDHAGQRLALAAALADLDVTIVEAASGREALRCLLQQEVAVILLDVDMPGLDGFETAALIRQHSRCQNTPIIFVTAFSDAARVARGYSLGAVDYILSPPQPDVLRNKVGVFIELDRKTEQITQQREALRRYAEQLQQLSRASLAIHSSRSVDDVARAVAHNAGRIVGARQTSVTLTLHDDTEAVTVTEFIDSDGSTRETTSRPRAAHRAPSPSQPQPPAQVALETRPLDATPPPAIIPQPRPWLAAPLTMRDGREVGMLRLSDRIDGEFTAEDQGIVVLLAQKASVAIENIAAAEAREANRLKDEFLGVLSHELRTPLQAMLTWIAILRKEAPDAALLARSLDVIERSARSQVQLIADLLEVSRIVRGQLHLDNAPVEVVKVVGLALEALRPTAAAKDLTLVWTPPTTECWIVGDSARLQQVVWNLVSNGIKFTPADGRVQVELDATDTDVTIRVRDTGKGIPAAFLPHVFDRFRQADSTSGRRHGGLGLGLSIVRHLVELHGGQVRAENVAPGSGALITVVLPRLKLTHPVSAVSAPSTARAARADENNGLQLDGMRIVLVEDEPDAREALTTALERFGAAVVAVDSAADALQSLQQQIPDILLSDIGMPGEDGYALIRTVRAAEVDGAHLPAVALTAYARTEDRNAVLQAGFDTHVQKPIDPENLARVVRTLAKRG